MTAEVVNLPIDGEDDVGVLGLHPYLAAVIAGQLIAKLWSWPLLMVAVDAKERAGELCQLLFA